MDWREIKIGERVTVTWDRRRATVMGIGSPRGHKCKDTLVYLRLEDTGHRIAFPVWRVRRPRNPGRVVSGF